MFADVARPHPARAPVGRVRADTFDRPAASTRGPSRDPRAADAPEVVARAAGRALPKEPPYRVIFGADGARREVEVRIQASSEILSDSGYDAVFEALGAHVQKTPGLWLIDHVVPDAAGAPVTFHLSIQADDRRWNQRAIFGAIGHETPPIEIYNDHSQFGRGLDSSLLTAAAQGVEGSEKLFLVLSCQSKVFADRLAKRFPKTQFVLTDWTEKKSDSPKFVAHLLGALARRESWATIRAGLSGSGAVQWSSYRFPDDARLLAYLDSDRDGVNDFDDTTLALGVERGEPPSLDTFTPRLPAAPIETLSGERVHGAIVGADAFLDALGYSMGRAERFYSAGFAPARLDGAPLEIAFAPDDPRAGAVKLNAAYAHLSETALTVLAAHELLRHVGASGHRGMSRLDERQKVILAHVAPVWLLSAWGRADLYPAYRERFPLERALSFSAVEGCIQRHHGVLQQTLNDVAALLEVTPDRAAGTRNLPA